MQDFGQPPVSSLDDPLADALGHPLEDPFEAMSKALEPDGNFDPFNRFDYTRADLEELFMDDLGRTLDALEASIEGTTEAPPPKAEEPLPPEPAPIAQGYTTEGPPRPPEGTERPWGDLKPPPAAIPYVTPTGLRTPSSLSHGNMGTGIRNTSRGLPEERYCELEQDFVPLKTCRDCEYYEPDAEVCTYYSEEES